MIETVTFAQFLAALSALRLRWWLDLDGRIRADAKGGRMVCPITALGEQERMFKYLHDADHIGLSRSLAVRISYAADYPEGHPACEAMIRRHLLATCGLREVRV